MQAVQAELEHLKVPEDGEDRVYLPGLQRSEAILWHGTIDAGYADA